ncbi:MAG TPA: hypothetical protein VGL61_21000 [Kofleriaceae bacterium]|jgi:TPR repeat protein
MIRFAIVGIAMLCAATAHADSQCASPSTCRPACDKGDASACEWLGSYYAQLARTTRGGALQSATRLLQTACTRGSGVGCEELASLLNFASTDHPDVDASKTGQLRTTACKLGDGDACDDTKLGQRLLERQCAAGVPHACLGAAAVYGPDPSAPPDDSGGTGTAMALDDGAPTTAPAVKPDPAKAKALRDRAHKLVADACAARRPRTCSDLVDWRPTMADLTTECDVGASLACDALVRNALSGTAGAPPWLDSAKRACDLGDFVNCERVEGSYDRGENGVTRDAAQASAFRVKSCDAFDATDCAMLGKAESDAHAKIALFERACTEGEIYGCEQAGDWLLAVDAKQALVVYAKACALEDKASALERPICGELAARYDATNPPKAKDLRAQGCKRGETSGC